MPRNAHAARRSTPGANRTNTNLPNPDFPALAKDAEDHGHWQLAARYYAQAMEERTAELALINSVQEGLSSRLEMQTIYDLVGDKLRDTFDAQVVMISQYDPETNKIFHHYAIERGRHLHIPGWHAIDTSRLAVVRTHRPFMINATEIEEVVNAGKMHVVPGTELPKTWLGVPLVVGHQVRGIVSLQNLDKENAFDGSDIALLTTLTNSMSLSLENARLFNETEALLNLLEREMEIARMTQQSILPVHQPRYAGYDIGSLMIPAKAVGGDFYDFIHMDNHQLCVVIGDVSDKGLPAALVMALTFSLVRAEAARNHNPLQVLQTVNRNLLTMNASGMYVTLTLCMLDFKTGAVSYLRAGHLPPLVMDRQGQYLDIPMDEGQPLGLFHEVRIDQQQVIIPEGGLMLLASDGLTEAVDARGKEFGIERVKHELRIHSQEEAQVITERLWQTVQTYSDKIPHQDDFTAVVIKRL